MFLQQLIISGGYFLPGTQINTQSHRQPEQHRALLRGLEEEEDAAACTEDGIKGSLQKGRTQKHEATPQFAQRTVNMQIFNFLNFFVVVMTVMLLHEESCVVLQPPITS